ncbi:hypothetical protein CMI38_03095 [Candidatus Pacearchaeota archaeon]|nr:hypothetical protein [Candidatus Pacearchaeota archaeon]|tara:strand:- start:2660 stop:2896 length:237 start_codon:yes stop_codon:yes gene_type:complete
MKKDAKNKEAKNKSSKGGVCHECKTCHSVSWVLPLVLLVIALVPDWLTSTWGKWIIVVIAALYLIKRVKPCKMCCTMK